MPQSEKGGPIIPFSGTAPSPPGVILRKTLGAVGVIIGTGLVVVMPFLDGLNGIRVSGAISAQDMGILAGFVVLLGGLLLYLGSIISFLEHRYRELELKVEGLSAGTGERPSAGPGKAIQKKTTEEGIPVSDDEIPAPAADDATEAREPLPPDGVAASAHTAPAGQAGEPLTTAAPSPEANGTAAPAPRSVPASVKSSIAAEPASVTSSAAAEPASVTSSATAEPASVTSSAAAEPASVTPSTATQPATPAPAPLPAEKPAYDYGTSPAQGAAVCRVCGNELSAGVCRYCITSASIQSAYQELSRTQELGDSIEEPAVLLESARRSLEEKDFLEAGEFVRSSRHFLEISAKTYFALRAAVEKAEAERKRLEDSGLDTTELSSKLSDVRSAIVKGTYHEAKALIDDERRAADDLRLPYFQRPSKSPVKKGSAAPPALPATRTAPVRHEPPAAMPARPGPPLSEATVQPGTVTEAPAMEMPAAAKPELTATSGPTAAKPELTVPEPSGGQMVSEIPAEPAPSKAPPVPAAVQRFKSGISGCPKCGRRTMNGWKKCPHCLTALQ